MEGYRGELFPEIEPKKRRFKRGQLKHFRLIKERYVRLSEEKIALGLLLLLFSLIFSYIWGYQKGVQTAKGAIPKQIREVKVTEVKKVGSEEGGNKGEEKARGKVKKPLAQYSIQLVTYKNLKYAKREEEKLKKMGYNPYILEVKGYKIVYVGKYKSRDEAEKDLRQLRKIYKDAFIKKLEEVN
jgi:hypothetical protein